MTPVDPPEPPTLPFVDPPTLRETPEATTVPARAFPKDDQTRATETYALGDVLGRGGMGEVVLAHDRRIGRDVALKRLLTETPTDDDVSRFLREARIQARLEHPAIPPVYELGRDANDRPFFTMKRLAGTTLADLLTGAPNRQRLLRAFVDVCRAVEFAHARGVVHRDLKPGNVVLGDFGEVYVLDWGIAQIIDSDSPIVTSDIDTLEGPSAPGKVFGTLGYMAPEQFDLRLVRPSADVYALGSILFEILAGEPLHPRGPTAADSTRAATTELSPAARRPDRAIPPELDAACVAALAMISVQRPSARVLGDRIQDYLDGDRDVDRRRALAAVHLARGVEAARYPESQIGALQNAGRALALDPEGTDAAALVTRLMLAPPRDLPPELVTRLRELDLAYSKRSARVGIYALAAFFAFIPLLLWSGFTVPGLAIGSYALAIGLIAYIYWFAGRGGRSIYVVLVGLATWVMVSSRVIGPFIIGPSIIGIIAMGLLAQPDLLRRPMLVFVVLLTAFLGPIVLEAIGAIDPTWSISGDSVVSGSAVIHLGGTPTTLILLIGNAATIVITGLFSRELSASRREAQRRVEIQAWRLEQLVPAPRARTTI
jgi:serine/threonine-protein kinase